MRTFHNSGHNSTTTPRKAGPAQRPIHPMRAIRRLLSSGATPHDVRVLLRDADRVYVTLCDGRRYPYLSAQDVLAATRNARRQQP